jgi:hypothetical protein
MCLSFYCGRGRCYVLIMIDLTWCTLSVDGQRSEDVYRVRIRIAAACKVLHRVWHGRAGSDHITQWARDRFSHERSNDYKSELSKQLESVRGSQPYGA